jgi:cell division protein FtsL
MNSNANLKKLLIGLLIMAGFFLLLFTYATLNMELIEYGYSLQELRKKEFALREEIDQLKARKAALTNLHQVEKVATTKLGYSFPLPEQVIKVFKKNDRGK